MGWWGNWRSSAPAHIGNLQPTDLLDCTSIIGMVEVNNTITGAQIIAGASSGVTLTVGTTPIASGTVGRILFQNGSNLLGQDSALFWDNTNKRLGIGATPDTSTRLDVRAQGALSTDIAFRVRNSANTIDRLSVTGTAVTIITSSRAEMSVSVNQILFGLDNHAVTFTHSSPGQVLQTQRSGGLAFCHYATKGLTNTETLTEGSSIFGATIRAGTLTNVQNKMHFVCDTAKWGTAGIYSAGFQWFKGAQSGDGAFSTSTLPSITTANRQMWLTPESSLLLTNSSGITYITNVDSFQMYSADITPFNAAPHFRTENGSIIKLYQQTPLVASATFVVGVGTAVTDASTFDGYTLGKVVKALRNLGLLT